MISIFVGNDRSQLRLRGRCPENTFFKKIRINLNFSYDSKTLPRLHQSNSRLLEGHILLCYYEHDGDISWKISFYDKPIR